MGMDVSTLCHLEIATRGQSLTVPGSPPASPPQAPDTPLTPGLSSTRAPAAQPCTPRSRRSPVLTQPCQAVLGSRSGCRPGGHLSHDVGP